LWFAILGSSGNRKTETVSAFEDEDKTIVVEDITEKTFVTGNPKFSENDLAPELQNKLMLTLDFATLLTKHSENLNQILSILRRAYEGCFYRRTGSGVDVAYKDIFFNWILCSTSAYDRSDLIRANLGQRELIYRLELEEPYDKEERNKKIKENSEHLEEMRRELRDAVQTYMKYWKSQQFKFNEIKVSPETDKMIEIVSEFIVYLRACAEIDTYEGEPIDFVEPEECTRVLAQLSSLCRVLLTLPLSENEALHVISEIAKSSMNRVRFRVLKEVYSGKVTSTFLARKFGMSWKTINAELQILYQLGFVDCEGEEGRRREWFVPQNLDPKKQAILDFIFPNQHIEPLEPDVAQALKDWKEEQKPQDLKLDSFEGDKIG
jgi:hypothetical protein